MKKTGGCVIFSWILAAVSILGLLVPISLERLQSTEVLASSSDNTDGVYTIEGRLWHATMDQPSMGNSALVQPMEIVKSGESVTLRMEFRPLNSGAFSGYLYSFHYFPSWNNESGVPNEAEEPVPVTVTEYYDGIYDDYNHPATGLDEAIRGKFYPHYAVMPIEWNAASAWVQVYVPVMEAISAGSGKQYARLLLDWDTLKKTEEKAGDVSTSPADPPSDSGDPPTETVVQDKDDGKENDSENSSQAGNEKLTIDSLKDGTYTVAGTMVKPDKKTKSMSNEAIDHNIILAVKKGKYSLTVSLSGLTVGNSKGYLSKLKYFKTGYKEDENGVPTGKKAGVTIKAYQKDDSGKKVSDAYGTDYPAKVTFPMISEAKKDGCVPLQVYVPIMEAISEGTGTQPVYLKLDVSSIVEGKKSEKSSSAKETSDKKNQSESGKSSTGSSRSSSKKKSASAAVNAGSDTGSGVKGTVYSCQVIPSYKHPVTGGVEDSGGASSYATGQGMVESVMGTSGMLEETGDGACYLTMRMSLMDMTSKHAFWVQKRGESGWKSVSATVTQNGTDKNGKTSDFCFSVPDKDSIVKVSMYVEPMGRDVVFYASLKNLKKGRPKDMKSTKVSGDAIDVKAAAEEGSAAAGELPDAMNIMTAAGEDGEDNAAAAGLPGETGDVSSVFDTGLGSAQGLSLSTEGADVPTANDPGSTEEDVGETAGAGGNGEMSFGKWILVLTLSATMSGLLLMAAGAGLAYYFRRNWRRWGEEMADDED
ncbi:MAG TPA: hypothetical protein DF613_03380 [Lachnospiraceae bacterium]|nr:hypothetical protein [Lachnospiraceae bacterium]